MFKVPDWEEDVPKNNLRLKKKVNSPKQQKIAKPASPKRLGKVNLAAAKTAPKLNKKHEKIHPSITKTSPKVTKSVAQTAQKRNHEGQVVGNKKKKQSEDDNVNFVVANVDTDKLDMALLNAKKKKFYESLKKDDVEDDLFKEETIENRTIHKAKSKKSQLLKNNVKTLQNGTTENMPKSTLKILQNVSAEKVKKNKNILEPKQEHVNNVFVAHTNGDVISNSCKKSGGVVDKKKERLRSVLKQAHRNTINVKGNKLRERMLERLKAAQFRYINEKLYTSSGSEAKELFQSDPVAFQTYHQGYQQQVKKWPVNPLDVIAKRIQKMPKTYLIADMGCGEAALSKKIQHTVRSFDLVSTAPGVETCDMAHTPLLSASMDVTVYCLALMGTELTQYLVEASRVLKMGGHLLIAEVESRFDDVDAFAKELTRLGFKLKNVDKRHMVFYFMEFVKVADPPVKKAKLPVLALKPCLYKRR